MQRFLRKNVSIGSFIFAFLIVFLTWCWDLPGIKDVLVKVPGSYFLSKFFVALLSLATVASFIVECFSVGCFFRRFLGFKISRFFWLQTGLGFSANCLFAFIFLHFYHVSKIGLLVTMVFVGLFSAVSLLSLKLRLNAFLIWIRNSWRLSPVLVGLTFFYVISCALLTFAPDPYVDVHFYHLLSAWKWSVIGKFYDLAWMPYYMQGGLAEYFYAILGIFVKDQMALLICGQMFHFCFGVIGAASLVYGLSRLCISKKFALLTLFAYVAFPCEYIMLMRAKNDGFVLFFSLSALILGIRMWQSNRKEYIYAPWFFSFCALSIKHSAIFFVASFWAVTVFRMLVFRLEFFAKLKHHFYAIAMYVVISMPILFRNGLITGDPFFPALSEIFSAENFINKAMAEELMLYTYVKGSIREIFVQQMSYFYLAKTLFVFAFFALFFKKSNQQMLGLVGIVAFGLFAVLTGKGFSVRFMFFMYGILAITSVFILEKIFTSWISQKWQNLAWNLFIVLALAGSAIEVPFLRLKKTAAKLYFSSISYAHYFSMGQGYYIVHQWANKNLQNPWILSSFDNEALFLDGKLSVPPNYIGASRVAYSKNFAEFRERFAQEGFTHLQINRDKNLAFEKFVEDKDFLKNYRKIFSHDHYDLYEFFL